MIKMKFFFFFRFWGFLMVVLQVPPPSLIHKMATKDHCRAIAIGNIYLDRDMEKEKKKKDMITFLKGQDVRHGSS